MDLINWVKSREKITKNKLEEDKDQALESTL